MYSSRSLAEKPETQKKSTHTHKTTKSKDNLQSHDNNKPTTPTSLPLSTNLDFKPQKTNDGTNKNPNCNYRSSATTTT
jgi:hypothetical protein